MTTTSRSEGASSDASRAASSANTGAAGAADSAREMAGTVMAAAGDAVSHLPEAAATTRDALADANRAIQSGSDETLSAGTLVTVGFALGLFVGGANRLLVLVALIPAALMGLTLMDRQNTTASGKSTTTTGR